MSAAAARAPGLALARVVLSAAGWALGLGLSACASLNRTAPPSASAPAASAPATPTPEAQPQRPGGAGLRTPLYPSGGLKPLSSQQIDNFAVHALTPPVDLWDRIRRRLSMPDLNSELVRARERWYVERPDYMARMTERSRKYLFHIVEELERRDLPAELALLPFIESAFNPEAVSRAKATGMWQFMPATGRTFDLRQGMFHDDRRDVLASTRAALDYLQKLYRLFGDWHLALAAYNWGEGSVQRAIARAQKAGQPTDYASLKMPMETTYYVPKLQALKNIVLAPQAFDLQLPDIGNHPYFQSVDITHDMDVALVAQLADVPEDDFRALNPGVAQAVLLAATSPQVLLPWDNAARFEVNLRSWSGPLASWTAWVAPQTLSVADAARRVGMSEADLRSANAIPPRMLVQAGSTLVVRRRADDLAADVSSQVADRAQLHLSPEVVLRKIRVQVRKGETLAALARRLGVAEADLRRWNRLSAKATVKPGLSLVAQLASPAKIASRNRTASRPPKAARSKPKSGSTVAIKSIARHANQTGVKRQNRTQVRTPNKH